MRECLYNAMVWKCRLHTCRYYSYTYVLCQLEDCFTLILSYHPVSAHACKLSAYVLAAGMQAIVAAHT